MRLFAHRLALALGEANVNRMLQNMPAEALVEWMAYDRIEPISTAQRIEYSLARMMALLANAYFKRRGDQPYKAKDFMTVWSEASQKQRDPREVYADLKAWALAVGVRAKRTTETGHDSH